MIHISDIGNKSFFGYDSTEDSDKDTRGVLTSVEIFTRVLMKVSVVRFGESFVELNSVLEVQAITGAVRNEDERARL